MVEVIWTKRAFEQLERNIKFIREENSSKAAKIVLSKILKSTKALHTSANLGTIEPRLAHKKSEYRFLIAFSYKIIYRKASDQKVVISRIFHMSRNPKRIKGV